MRILPGPVESARRTPLPVTPQREVLRADALGPRDEIPRCGTLIWLLRIVHVNELSVHHVAWPVCLAAIGRRATRCGSWRPGCARASRARSALLRLIERLADAAERLGQAIGGSVQLLRFAL